MFHIKTDIRQYKCETTAKVERLIRNWVIRPSDLIYNADDKTWNPIGQHPAFNDIFSVIEQEEANEPDTIVTEAPSEVAAEHEVEPGSELEDEPDDGLHADSEEITNVRPAPSAPGDEAGDDEVTDVREDPRAADTDEQDAAAPPEAPDGVEGLIRDSDEITMMTDKTFEMLREEASGDKQAADEEAAADEDTQLVERDEVLADGGSAVAEESAAPDEETQVVERDEVGAESEADEAQAEADDADAAADDADEADEADEAEEPATGRHGLPEEVFVTDEIPRQSVEQAVIDELGELEEESEPEDDEVTEVVDQDDRKPRWRIVMSDDLDDEEDGDREEGEASDQPDADQPDVDDQELEEAGEADADVEAEADEGLEESSDAGEDEELDDMLDEAAELVGLGEESDAVDIDDGALEPVEDDDEPRERTETPVRAVPELEEFVSEGYKLPLPVDISPSAEDIRLGLKHSRVGKSAKDATFPYPEPKKRDEIITRRFDLDPEEPKDHSLLIVAAFVVGLLVLLVGAITMLG